MRLLLGFVLGLTGAALFLSSLDHQAVTQELRAWLQAGPISGEPRESEPSPAGDTLPAAAPTAPDPALPQTSAQAEAGPPAEAVEADPDPETASGPGADTGIVPQQAPWASQGSPVEPLVPAWQPIWRPFKAPSAAEGFAAHLTALTGDTYRVRRVADRAFQVEAAYRSEAERRAHLERVRALTGLELDGGRP